MNVDTLDATSWDVLIAGTGLHESLLALALSRSGKKILHVDRNDYYGGADAALSLQDAENWASSNAGSDATSCFARASVDKSPTTSDAEGVSTSQISFSRAYSLALSPQILYAQSTILPTLVSSKVDQQLEFLAVGSCFVFTRDTDPDPTRSDAAIHRGRLVRVPNSREDVFADESLEPRHKRGLMKFLRFISDFEEQRDTWEPFQSDPFDAFLSAQFNLPPVVQQPLHALTLSRSLPENTSTSFALPRIARHLRSIGIFGPGFGSVIPKWGGLAEIAQVGCRACAVGGGVYVLGNGLESVEPSSAAAKETVAAGANVRPIHVRLARGESVMTDWVVAAHDNYTTLPLASEVLGQREQILPHSVHWSICIVSSALSELFPQLVEGAPTPAAAVVVIPSSSLFSDPDEAGAAPIHVMVHSSDTGECPAGQSVLYASVASNAENAHSLLENAVSALLQSIHEEPPPRVLWKLEYEQHSPRVPSDGTTASSEMTDRIIVFPPSPQDLAFDDAIMRHVRDAWQKIMGPDGGDFMMFPAREGINADDDDEG